MFLPKEKERVWVQLVGEVEVDLRRVGGRETVIRTYLFKLYLNII